MKSAQELRQLADRLLDCFRTDMPPALGDLTLTVAELREHADLLSRLEKAEAQLREADWLIKEASPRSFSHSNTRINWINRRDAWIAARTPPTH